MALLGPHQFKYRSNLLQIYYKLCYITLLATMSERKAVIKNADMSEEMQQDAVDCSTQALEKYNIEKDIAAYIKKEFDKKYNPTWHCIVGRNFGSYVTHETKHFIYFYLGQVAILLFKSGWPGLWNFPDWHWICSYALPVCDLLQIVNLWQGPIVRNQMTLVKYTMYIYSILTPQNYRICLDKFYCQNIIFFRKIEQ